MGNMHMDMYICCIGRTCVGQQLPVATVLGKVGFGEKQVTINILMNRWKILPQSSVSLSISF